MAEEQTNHPALRVCLVPVSSGLKLPQPEGTDGSQFVDVDEPILNRSDDQGGFGGRGPAHRRVLGADALQMCADRPGRDVQGARDSVLAVISQPRDKDLAFASGQLWSCQATVTGLVPPIKTTAQAAHGMERGCWVAASPT